MFCRRKGIFSAFGVIPVTKRGTLSWKAIFCNVRLSVWNKLFPISHLQNSFAVFPVCSSRWMLGKRILRKAYNKTYSEHKGTPESPKWVNLWKKSKCPLTPHPLPCFRIFCYKFFVYNSQNLQQVFWIGFGGHGLFLLTIRILNWGNVCLFLILRF